MKPKVAVLKVTSATEENIQSSLSHGLSNIADFNALLNAEKVIIKVNLCKPFPANSGATVDIRITENIVRLVLERNPSMDIYIVESNSGSRNAEEAFRETEYLSLEKRYKNVHIVNLSKTSQVTVNDPRLRYFKKGLRLSYTFLECNYFISISKLKTHEFERFTGILKNQFGCISTKNKEQYHPYLSEVIGDINSVLKPDLCVIDGLIAMEGRGPGFGDPKEMNLLIMGDDPVATDAVASTIIGINPYDVPHLKATAKRGLGEIELKNICISGERVEDVESNFNFIPPLAFLFFRLSLRIHRLAHFFGALVTFFSFFGRQLERLARALYTRSLMEVLIRVARGGLRIPRPIHKLLLILYLSLRYFKK